MLRGNYYLESWLVKTIIIGSPTSCNYALSKYQQQPWMIILFKRTMKTSSSHRINGSALPCALDTPVNQSCRTWRHYPHSLSWFTKIELTMSPYFVKYETFEKPYHFWDTLTTYAKFQLNQFGSFCVSVVQTRTQTDG